MRAALYGVGLYTMEQDGVQVLAEPEPYARHRHTAAHWWFAEQIWDQVSVSAGRAATAPRP